MKISVQSLRIYFSIHLFKEANGNSIRKFYEVLEAFTSREK